MGAQKTIERSIHREWIARGHDSVVLYAVGVADEKGVLCYESAFTMLMRRLLRKVFGKDPRFSRLSTDRLIRRLRTIKPDLVHLHVLHNGYIDYERLFRFLSEQKIPVVYTVHDMWAFTGGCYYYTKEHCTRYQTGCQQCPASANRLDNPVDKTALYYNVKKQLFSKLDKVQFIAVSEWVADEMKKSFLAEYPITVIDNGIDRIIPAINATRERDDEHIVMIGVAATWDERKGIDRILEMARLLGESYRFELVGYVSQDIKDAASDNVCFLGYISDKEKLLRAYARADLHISASLEETFGMTFVEAAFMGTRSVGYATTAVADTLRGVEGIAVTEMTARAMAEAIRSAVQKGMLKLTQQEIERVVERYSSETMAKAYCDSCLSFLCE